MKVNEGKWKSAHVCFKGIITSQEIYRKFWSDFLVRFLQKKIEKCNFPYILLPSLHFLPFSLSHKHSSLIKKTPRNQNPFEKWMERGNSKRKKQLWLIVENSVMQDLKVGMKLWFAGKRVGMGVLESLVICGCRRTISLLWCDHLWVRGQTPFNACSSSGSYLFCTNQCQCRYNLV